MRLVLVIVLVGAILAGAGACGRDKPVTTPPPEPPTAPVAPVASDTAELRYAARGPLLLELSLELTHTGPGQYIEAELRVSSVLELASEGQVLRTRWALEAVDALELTGTVKKGERERVSTLLSEHGKGIAIGDALGAIDLAATDADPLNEARRTALGAKGVPRAAVLLLPLLAEHLRLPRLPAQPLKPGETVELAEESETVVADAKGAELVLPTTTIHRFTLRSVEALGGSRVAEVAIDIASVAQPEDEEAATKARLESRSEGKLLFDLEAGAPVSLELSRTDSFTIGKATGERSLLVRSRFRKHEEGAPP